MSPRTTIQVDSVVCRCCWYLLSEVETLSYLVLVRLPEGGSVRFAHLLLSTPSFDIGINDSFHPNVVSYVDSLGYHSSHTCSAPNNRKLFIVCCGRALSTGLLLYARLQASASYYRAPRDHTQLANMRLWIEISISPLRCNNHFRSIGLTCSALRYNLMYIPH